jgi:hypothetical protein
VKRLNRFFFTLTFTFTSTSTCDRQGALMDKDKEKQEISLIGRILSLEALLLLMGTLSLVFGILYSQGVQVILGLVIIGSSILFIFMRKKLWKKQ